MNATEEYLTEAFKEQGLVTQEIFDQTLAEAKGLGSDESSGDSGLDFFNLLLSKLGLSTDEVVNFLSAELSMDPIDLSTLSLTPEVLSLVNPDHARLYEAIPLGTDGSSVDVVLGNPLDQDAIDNLGHLLGKPVNPRVAYRGDVLDTINQLYGLNEQEKEKIFLMDWGRAMFRLKTIPARRMLAKKMPRLSNSSIQLLKMLWKNGPRIYIWNHLRKNSVSVSVSMGN